MSILVFLRGFVGALLSFAVITYVVSGSLWTTLSADCDPSGTF